jgi:hypothetical protein
MAALVDPAIDVYGKILTQTGSSTFFRPFKFKTCAATRACRR